MTMLRSEFGGKDAQADQLLERVIFEKIEETLRQCRRRGELKRGSGELTCCACRALCDHWQLGSVSLTASKNFEL
jgi:hypothetical protein